MDDLGHDRQGRRGDSAEASTRSAGRPAPPPSVERRRAPVAACLSHEDRNRVADGVADALRMAVGLRPEHLHVLATWIADVTGTSATGARGLRGSTGDDGSLTAREAEVLGRIAAGRSNKEIGVDLGIAERTAEVHVSNVLRKLGVTNRVEAATTWLRLGLDRGVGAS